MKTRALIIFISGLAVNLFIFTDSKALISKNDSLRKVFNSLKSDSGKIKLLNEEIGYAYEKTDKDSAILFYRLAIMLADKSLKNKNLNTQDINNYIKLKSTSILYIGNVHYAEGDFEKAKTNYSISLKLFGKINDSRGTLKCQYNLANIYYYSAEYNKAEESYIKALNISKKSGEQNSIALCYNNMGNLHSEQGNYSKALEYYLSSLEIREKLNDERGLIQSMLNIGIVHFEQKNYEKALDYFSKSLLAAEKLDDMKYKSYCYTNIASVHYEKANAVKEKEVKLNGYKLAVSFYIKALKIREEAGDTRGAYVCFINIGNVYKDIGNSIDDISRKNIEFEKSEYYYKKALKITQSLGDKKGTATIFANLASLYNTTAYFESDSSQFTKKLKNAIEFGIKGFGIARETNSASLVFQTAEILCNTYKSLSNYSKALEFAEIVISTKDTIFSEEKTRSLAEAEKKFEAEKKQLQIEKLNKEKALQGQTIARKEAESKKQRILIISFMAGFILILVFSVFLYRLFLLKKKANLIISEKNRSLKIAYSEISTQKEEIETQRDEIETQRDKLSEQNVILTEQKKEITDSITYAKRIQYALLPDFNKVFYNIRNKVSDTLKAPDTYFILFKPKDIVSGDFYWAANINEWLIVTVADCTGHGVPGAFMSMLGISFLNEIVRKKEIVKASDVLDNLRASVIEALKQHSGERSDNNPAPLWPAAAQALDVKDMPSKISSASAVRDGMDMALCALNTESLVLQYAGANNSLYIVSCNEFANIKPVLTAKSSYGEQEIKYLYELKADKQPVGIHFRMKPFTNNEVQLSTGDLIYLFSDGYHDQFGGPDNRKFMAKRLKELIAEIAFMTFDKQKEILNSIIDEWKEGYEQIDDITILGLKI